MKFIKPSVEYLPQKPGIGGIWHQIAIATRVCYQSKPREGESDESFVKRVIFKPALRGTYADGKPMYNFNRMHGSVLEHGTVYLTMPNNRVGKDDIDDLIHNKYTEFIDFDDGFTYITTNMRVIVENYLEYLLNDYLSPRTVHIPRYTFSIISNIGVTREFNRHRVNSPSEESTRWCTYSAGKFGSEISYAEQDWMGSIYKRNVGILSRMTKLQQLDAFKNLCKMIAESNIENWTKESFLNFGLAASEFSYLGMKERHATNDEARTVLNLGTKTQEIVTAFSKDWLHFLELRDEELSGHVHPDMKIIAKKIKKKSLKCFK